jgi:pimeloyl-ACP methyl ester carboxylesterase
MQATYLDWQLVQPEIAHFARVCLYDRAGYGWSDPSPRARVPSVMAEELHSLLHKSGEPGPYILVAHSFGSYNAVMFAHKYPQEVAGLVLADGLHTLSEFPFRLRERVSLRAMQLMIPFGIPRWRGWCGGNRSPAIRGELRAILCRPREYEAFYREGADLPSSVREMRTVTSLGSIPLIVIARDPSLAGSSGGDDWNLIQKQKLGLSTNSELIVATGSGHDIPTARPDVIVAAVKKLVTQTPGTGGHPGKSFKYSLPA